MRESGVSMNAANTNPNNSKGNPLLRFFRCVFLVALSLGFLLGGFQFLKRSDISKPVLTTASVIWGVAGIALLFWVLNYVVDQLPEKIETKFRPLVFIGPALAILLWFVIIPTFRTVYLSFFDKLSQNYVGFKNYFAIFTDRMMLEAFRNNVIWLLFGTFFTVVFGLIIAVLADKSKYEKLAKSIIFMPTAISFVGSSVIWKFVYTVKPSDEAQIGVLNAIISTLGGTPRAFYSWTDIAPWNNLFLVIIFIWLQTGYAMMLFSSAVKGTNKDLLDAARVDGANEFQVFWHITIPCIKGTIITTSTTIAVMTLKIFDIVMTMTGGQFGTEVIATNYYRQYFTNRNYGYGSSIAIILLILVLPVMYYNLRNFKERGEGF